MFNFSWLAALLTALLGFVIQAGGNQTFNG